MVVETKPFELVDNVDDDVEMSVVDEDDKLDVDNIEKTVVSIFVSNVSIFVERSNDVGYVSVVVDDGVGSIAVVVKASVVVKNVEVAVF